MKIQPNMMQWTVEATRIREAADVAKMALGLVFASAFQVPILAQSSLYRICTHPDSLDKLREEACESQGLRFENNNREMPYLDSFIKESARLGPGPIRKCFHAKVLRIEVLLLSKAAESIVSVPRKVMSRYTSPEGVIVPAGNWIAVPQLPLMRDAGIWPNGGAFDGFRFVQRDDQSISRLTHPSLEFPFWGSIRHACPARFYVSTVVKMVLSHLLVAYEFKLENPTAKPVYSFGKARLPSPFMTLLVRKRVLPDEKRE
ncbi:MAG: hypothetical protein LQ337_002663 [Flavoplaca oasis]|nr:MAG: hypothetical protein LQ337_002663 [Flavoplaca oasis]